MARNPYGLSPRLLVQAGLAKALRLEGKVSVPNPLGGPPVVLRGPFGLPRPPSPYLVDLTDPSKQHLMTRRADTAGRTAYILDRPASNLGVRAATTPQQMRDFAAGKPVDLGPRVTFENDDRNRPSTNRPLTAATAGMVAGAIVDSGLRSVNINSTIRPPKKPDKMSSLHEVARGVDINRVNDLKVGFPRGGGKYVRNPAALPHARALQDALARQPNVLENFGPAYQQKSYRADRPSPIPSARAGHQNHVHGGGRR